MQARDFKLLILDDSREDRTIVRYMLEAASGRKWVFLEEEKGAVALHRLQNETVDCILLNYHLPDMNAIFFLRELARRFGPLSFPVIVFTGGDRTGTSEQSLKAGAQGHLSKAMIRADILTRAIDKAAERVAFVRGIQRQQEGFEGQSDRSGSQHQLGDSSCAW